VLLAVALAAAAMTAPARAQDSGVPTAQPIRWIERCADVPSGSVVGREELLQLLAPNPDARALDALGTSIGDPAVSVEELRLRLAALLQMPCFEAAELDARAMPPPFRSRLAANAWWVEGGRRWLEQFVGRRDFSGVWVFPPSERPSINREALPTTDALREVACPETATDCVRTSREWAVRLRAAIHPLPSSPGFLAIGSSGPDPEDDGQRFVNWHDSVELARDPVDALPVGTLGVPRDGWLVVEGMQLEIIALDIAQGTVHIARRGRDDRVHVTRGVTRVSAVQELTWAMATLSRLDHHHLPVLSARLPEGLRPRFHRIDHRIQVDTCRDPGGGSQYALRWQDGDVLRAEWYSRGDTVDADRHLAVLLDVILADMHESCVRGRPPIEALGGSSRDRYELELQSALVLASPTCT
jgi:hypothetical protein